MGSARILRNSLELLGINISITTINRRLKQIANQNDPEIDPHETNKNAMISGVEAVINYARLDMGVYTFLISPQIDNWDKNLRIIQKFCELHPYTLYFNKVFGDKNALFIQFSIPLKKEAEKHLLEAIAHLQSIGVISDYELFIFDEQPIRINTNLTKWDEFNHTWRVDFDKVRDMLHSKHGIGESPKNVAIKSILPHIDIFDTVLIREMTKNARIRQQTLLRNIPKNKYYEKYSHMFPRSKQSLSGRIKNLKNQNVFSYYRLLYDTKMFSMFNEALYILEMNDEEKACIISCLKNDILPFQGSFSISGNTGFFRINCPPKELADLTDALVDRFPKLRFFLFGNTQLKFHFWFDNLNLYTRYWHIDHKYMVENPLNQLEKYISQL